MKRQNDVVSSHPPPAWRTDLFETDEPTEHTVPAHRAAGTLDQGGALRFSPGFFSTVDEIRAATEAVRGIVIR